MHVLEYDKAPTQLITGLVHACHSIWFHLVEQSLCNATVAGENRVAGEEIEM